MSFQAWQIFFQSYLQRCGYLVRRLSMAQSINFMHWSIIILAPVVSKETLDIENKKKIFPLKKPIY